MKRMHRPFANVDKVGQHVVMSHENRQLQVAVGSKAGGIGKGDELGHGPGGKARPPNKWLHMSSGN
jgi:hypothetical protein